MRDAVVLGVLVARSGVDPESDGGGGRARVLRRHAEAVVQDGDLGGGEVGHGARRRRVQAEQRPLQSKKKVANVNNTSCQDLSFSP